MNLDVEWCGSSTTFIHFPKSSWEYPHRRRWTLDCWGLEGARQRLHSKEHYQQLQRALSNGDIQKLQKCFAIVQNDPAFADCELVQTAPWLKLYSKYSWWFRKWNHRRWKRLVLSGCEFNAALLLGINLNKLSKPYSNPTLAHTSQFLSLLWRTFCCGGDCSCMTWPYVMTSSRKSACVKGSTKLQDLEAWQDSGVDSPLWIYKSLKTSAAAFALAKACCVPN